MRKKHVLYAGDSEAGGPANYLLAILNTLSLKVTHVPPGTAIKKSQLEGKIDTFIFSDYSHDDLSPQTEKMIAAQVEAGAGLLMIGGWGSFSGPFGKWRDSLLSEYLPVICSSKDDRVNISSGLLIQPKKSHPILNKLPLQSSPVICGFNRVVARKNADILLTLREMRNQGGNLRLLKQEYPFLVVSEGKKTRAAALTTDLAPHWCGGWVDWGKKHKKLPVTKHIGVEVGDAYIQFAQQLVRWLIKS